MCFPVIDFSITNIKLLIWYKDRRVSCQNYGHIAKVHDVMSKIKLL